MTSCPETAKVTSRLTLRTRHEYAEADHKGVHEVVVLVVATAPLLTLVRSHFVFGYTVSPAYARIRACTVQARCACKFVYLYVMPQTADRMLLIN